MIHKRSSIGSRLTLAIGALSLTVVGIIVAVSYTHLTLPTILRV